ncbi:uncharacterized protein GGS22DRAFT_162982 [Annulohypoxylon maeteangense]|uniref:uncharacterized protein n=1 Tax=Annulohypoxylon maeteangense TaxID=1927788 RepID=UPI00200821CA|nr:uncharacterized protein GGS22DRAFT_162982 [Annulohypoxylon maeteangense]KAI0885184.1 hypothetical protein GGS22DRAFT_162982 [Annulohypoxylon maeteangense]
MMGSVASLALFFFNNLACFFSAAVAASDAFDVPNIAFFIARAAKTGAGVSGASSNVVSSPPVASFLSFLPVAP